MRPLFRYLILGFLTCSACAGLVYYQLGNQPLSLVQHRDGQGQALLGGSFNLIDQFDKRRSSEEFKGKIMLIYFGYSFCPDICPMGLQNITQALTLLGRDRDQIVSIFITVDPKRDTSKHLAIYATNFHPSFIMLTGTLDEIEKVKKDFRVYAAPAMEGHKADSNDYLIDHTTLVYVMDKKGTYVESFAHSTPPEMMVRIVQKVLMKGNHPQTK